jgi:hypothetical protein
MGDPSLLCELTGQARATERYRAAFEAGDGIIGIENAQPGTAITRSSMMDPLKYRELNNLPRASVILPALPERTFSSSPAHSL